jgi:UDP-N-acetylmuramate--alanine ligase
MEHVHLIGIGGSGLAPIATVLLERGYTVSGSDRLVSPNLQRLQNAGAKIIIGHHHENILGADMVIRSSAIPDDNVEVQAAISAGIPVYKRVDFLGKLMTGQKGIAIAGTHGKTTTTAMIASVLCDLGLDPSFIVGSTIVGLGINARAGRGDYFVIEADEYDRMFLGLHPWIAVVTNIEHDHPDCYPTQQDFYRAFQEFIGLLEPGGVLVACADDAEAARLAGEARREGRQVLVYGILQSDCDYRARSIAPNSEGGSTFSLERKGVEIVPQIVLRLPGEHNVLNALAALIVTDFLGLPMKDVAEGLGKFQGTGRRFEIRGEVNGVLVINDYAHHPTEIRATLNAARVRLPDNRIWAVWQPHTYSRIRALYEDYLVSFNDADCVLVTEIYAAREMAPADHFSARQLVEAMAGKRRPSQSKILFAPDLTKATSILMDQLRPGDVVLVLSAGDADRISEQLMQALPGMKQTASVQRRRCL